MLSAAAAARAWISTQRGIARLLVTAHNDKVLRGRRLQAVAGAFAQSPGSRCLLGSTTTTDATGNNDDKHSKPATTKPHKEAKQSTETFASAKASGSAQKQDKPRESSTNEDEKVAKARPRTPLPAIHRNNPEDEFITRSQYETHFQSFHRRNVAPMMQVTGEVMSLVASKETFYIVSGAGIILLSIGASEAFLCLSSSVPKLSSEALHFVWSYATSQLLPSFIWSTTPADLICHSIGVEASHMLRTFDSVPYETSVFGGGTDGIWSPHDAQRQLQLISLQCLRSVLAQSILLANVLNAVNRVVRVNSIIEQRVLDGQEPFPSGVREKVVRFCGMKSEVSTVTLRYSADHLIPVYESAEIGPYLARRRMEELHDPTLITPKERIHSRFSSYLYPQHQPMYWRVPPGSYLTPWAWSGFNFDPDFFLKTTTFKRILYLEADATNEEDSLSLGQRARDLTIQAASQGCWGFEQFVRSLPQIQQNVATKNFRVCRVFLGDLQQVHRTGGGLRISAGIKLKYLKEFDVMIDSQLVVLAAILKWCRRVTKDQVVKEGQKKKIAFHTTNSTFFTNLQLLLECFDYELKDSVEVQDFEQARYELLKGDRPEGEDGEPAPLWVDTSIPHLVYHETSAESVIEAKHLLSAGLVDPALCCVLVDSFEEYRLIQDMISYRYPSASELKIICSPVLYDEALRSAREWTRMGHSAKEIQDEIDASVEHLTEALNSYKLRQNMEQQKRLAEAEEQAAAATAAAAGEKIKATQTT